MGVSSNSCTVTVLSEEGETVWKIRSSKKYVVQKYGSHTNKSKLKPFKKICCRFVTCSGQSETFCSDFSGARVRSQQHNGTRQKRSKHNDSCQWWVLVHFIYMQGKPVAVSQAFFGFSEKKWKLWGKARLSFPCIFTTVEIAAKNSANDLLIQNIQQPIR